MQEAESIKPMLGLRLNWLFCRSVSAGGDVDRKVAGQGIENSLDRKDSTGFESLEPGGQCVLKSLASHRSQLPVDERQNRLGGELGEGL